MAVARVERRLAAILAADVVGYSRLMGQDEPGTLARLKELIEPRIAAYHGRIVKLMGDGALVEFASVVDAVECAAEIQRAVAEHNRELSPERRIGFRIGINLGDILVEGDDIYGDGVNVAARLEALAEPGGICISDVVHHSVHGKVDLSFDDLGEQRVKNIAEPVRAYRARLEPDATGVVTMQPVKLSRLRWIAALAAAVALLVAGGAVGWRFYLQPLIQERAFVEQTTLPLPEKPSVVVLPFDNLSGDPEQDYFSDGITDDLTTHLSQLTGLFVIARNTAFTYKGRAVSIPEVGRELGVRYVIEGSVQRAGERVRINAQLIDAATGFHLWADRFDREMEDVFALQDEVTQRIVAALEVELTERERETLASRYTDSLGAYDAFLQGWEQLWRGSHEANLRARGHFEQAIRLDPRFARAHANLALTYVSETGLLLPEGSLERAYELAQTAVAIDDSLPQVHWVLAEVHTFRGELELALAASDKVLSLEPNYADGYAQRSAILRRLGRPEEALAFIERAMRLNPHYPAMYLRELGEIQFTMRRYEDAIATFEAALERHPNLWDARLYLAATYAHTDCVDDAEWQLLEVLTVNPDLTLPRLGRISEAYANETDLRHLMDGLRKAGLPE